MTTNDGTLDDTTELVVEQLVAAPIADVWVAWTTVQGLARWWWPHWPDTVYEMEAMPSGRWSARSEEGETGGVASLVCPPSSRYEHHRRDPTATSGSSSSKVAASPLSRLVQRRCRWGRVSPQRGRELRPKSLRAASDKQPAVARSGAEP